MSPNLVWVPRLISRGSLASVLVLELPWLGGAGSWERQVLLQERYVLCSPDKAPRAQRSEMADGVCFKPSSDFFWTCPFGSS